MSQSAAYRVGRFLGKIHPSVYTFSAIALIAWAAITASDNPSQKVPTPAPVQAKIAASSAQERCLSQREQLLADYKAQMDKGLPWQAATTLRVCAGVLGDPQLNALVVSAEIADAEKTAKNKNASLLDRTQAIDRLERMDPARATALKSLKALLEKESVLEADRNRKAVAAQKKREGVRIGMTQEDVMASSWGKPQRINKSIYSFGVHEQWVYGGSNYLYFKDGILDSIQTGN